MNIKRVLSCIALIILLLFCVFCNKSTNIANPIARQYYISSSLASKVSPLFYDKNNMFFIKE